MLQLPVLTYRTSSNRCFDVVPSASGPTLVAALLAEQQSLSAVEHFARWHDADDTRGSAPSLASSRYRALLPAAAPQPGQQYAFEVDLDRCSGCKACVTACHMLNGLDESETWRDVGLLLGGTRGEPIMQHVTAACHHCLEPACLIACPVNAYEKDPTTGIVKHLDDQCFGCQYCTMACPYDVPKYHSGKGIVRKCDMCSSRLKVGEPPACVQACPHEAIAIRVVSREQVREDAEAALFLPTAPDPQITLPTTTYKTRRPFPRNLLPADYFRVNSQHAHWPLVVMLVLTQLSVGAFFVNLVFGGLLGDAAEPRLPQLHAVSALSFGLLALSASLLHLGRPRFAFRAVLGLRHSWLSREIVAFGLFALLALFYASVLLTTQRSSVAEHGLAALHATHVANWKIWLGWSVATSGALGVFCSVMVYVFTGRECWSFTRVALRFSFTAAILGVAAAWLSILMAMLVLASPGMLHMVREHGPLLCQTLMVLALAKLVCEVARLRHLLFARMTPLKRSALLHTRELSNVTLARFALGLLGGLVMPAMLLEKLPTLSGNNIASFAAITGLLFAANLAGELLERYLFFAACAAPRMPGGIR